MKQLIIGIIFGMFVAGVGQIAAYDWQADMALQEQRRQTLQLEEIYRQNKEIIKNQKNPC